MLLVGLAVPVLAQELCPPESSILIGSHGRIPFAWPGTAKEYLLQVQTAGKTVFEGKVQGNSTTLDLRSNLAYRWNVAPLTGGLGASGDTHAFQLKRQLVYSYDGPRGQPPPTKQPHHGRQGFRGGDGARGQNLTVQLKAGPVPALTQLSVEAERSRATYFLLSGSDPVTITARGGEGAEGGSGSPGSPAYLSRTMPNGFVEATSGTDGGPGGQGGDGGAVLLITNGLNWNEMLKFILDGGPGGIGGFAGAGGAGLNTYPGNVGGGYMGPGRSGSEGSKGRDGVKGTLSVR